jgi:threonine/homoserine/homoserine lactone efflux protein
MTASSVFAFWIVAVVLIATPGADWAFTLSAGLRGRSVVAAVGGLILGYALVTVVIAAGIGAVVARYPSILTGLTIVGGCYLIWHGGTTLAGPTTPDDQTSHASDAVPARTHRSVLMKGVGVSGLNPKGLLIFLALLPQFTDPQWSWPVAGQIAILGLTFIVTCAVFYLSLGLLARTMLHARPTVARTLSRISGASMVAIGITLVIERLIT